MIELNQYERKWIKLCKLHFKEEYPWKGSWCETLKPLFKEIYGWEPDEYYHDYLRGIFDKLLDIYLKIKDEWAIENAQIKEVFYAAFAKSISCDEELPIERAISKLCGLIQGVQVIEEDGTIRFEL